MSKIVNWVRALIATAFGLFQAFLKAVKEGFTGVVNLVSIVIPFETSQTIIEKIREIVNTVDGFVEEYKNKLLEPIL